MKRWFPVLFVLVALVLGYVALLSTPARRSGGAPPEEAAEAPAEAVTAEAEAAPAAPPKPQPASQAQTAPAPSAEDVGESEWEPTGDPTGILKAAFEHESRDALWADATERRIRETLGAQEVSGDAVREVSCRRTVCRIELRWRQQAGADMANLNKAVGEHWAPIIGIEQLQDPPAARAMNLYVIRRGYTLEDVGR